ncbi:MAG: hypothetical protein J6Z16_03035 [Candidatus Methanomethylophilaceae archaeon]|nr:hypothetical protein [Candidatus Methanomethylophilaceae archaeon]
MPSIGSTTHDLEETAASGLDSSEIIASSGNSERISDSMASSALMSEGVTAS